MKKTQINLSARYAAAFGVVSMIDKVKINEQQTNDYSLDFYPARYSDFEKVAFEIDFTEKDGKRYTESLEFSTVLTGAWGNIFAPPLMMTFSQEKSLIETEVNDDDPVVIERWGTKPWNIEIKGLLIDLDERVYPNAEIERLNTLWSKNTIIAVEGLQFDEKNIDAIYFKSIEFSPLEGFQDTIQFSISASSIKSVAFTLGKPDVKFDFGSVEVFQEDGTVF
ncbi:DUF6046 domain-containing protein [Empedobacter sp. GD03797]|uniref:DUF6046 domain-containing protein n=1 Tax=Empedobacter sp. GD03797 TaxID=2975382 RepID=UPI00244C696E|nr:DUF6046 domain-containing protein [Empedobacter sp. GD03797]MDH1883964.1 DUF6046 domain-containing protein [Empedobacter sp. GD03797]